MQGTQTKFLAKKPINVRNQPNFDNKGKNRKSLYNYEYCTCSSKKLSGFEVMTNFVTSHNQEKFDRG